MSQHPRLHTEAISPWGSSSRRRSLLRVVAPAALLTLYFTFVALLTTASRYEPGDLALLCVCYALLALVLHLGAQALTRVARPLGALGALGVGFVAVWHFREQTWLPAMRSSFVLAWLLASAVYAALRWITRGGRQRGLFRSALIATVALAVVVGAAYSSSNTFRWHLLRHNKLLGTPAFLVLGTPVQEMEARVWAEHPPAESGSGMGVPTAPGAPNLVFLMLDTLRSDGLAAYGGDPELMPILNRRAERSWVLGDLLSNAPWTRPSIASMITGLLPEEHGAVNRFDRLPERRITLAELMRVRGYQTAAFVANIAAAGAEAGFGQGFEEFREIPREGQAYARADVVIDAAARWLASERSPDDPDAPPLFLFVHLLDPHAPYLSGGARSSPRHDVALESYRTELRFLDQQLGRLFQILDTTLPGRTVLLAASDHGEEFGEHGERGHGHSLYPEVLEIPAVLDLGDGTHGRLEAALEGRDLYDLLLRATATGAFDPEAWARSRARKSRYASVYLTTGDTSFHRPYLHTVVMRGLQRDDEFSIWSGYGETRELYDRGVDRGMLRNLADERNVTPEELRGAMDGGIDHWARRDPIEQSDATLEQLRALGYVLD